MKISTVAQMRAMDRAAIEGFNIPEIVLMENAGQAAYAVLRRRVRIGGQRFVIVCGSGNNGGDGFVVARKIIADGGRAKVFILGDRQKFSGAARIHLDILENLPVEIRPLTAVEALQDDLDRCDGIVDAILGTGLQREVRQLHARVIEGINAARKPVLSVDIPSGINGDSGQVMGAAVRADATVSFGLPKIGNLLYPGYAHGGRLYVSHISFPPALTESADLHLAVNTPLELPPREASGHKGSFGQVLFIAGAASYFGAPYFAALSFLKSGGGVARLATPAAMAAFIAGQASELVLVPQEATAAGSIAAVNLDALLTLALQMDMVVMGPGLSLEAETQELVRELTLRIQCPLLLDGDGITAVCGHRQLLRDRPAATLLTPHMGEMARLTGTPVAEIQPNKTALLAQTAADLKAHIVLKGPHSLVGYPDGRVFVNLSGNAGMATAGSGDVLAGTVAAMQGLGLGPTEALRQGVFVHGVAGDLAAAALGEDGVTAGDIMAHLPRAIKAVRAGLGPDLCSRYGGPAVI